MKKIIQITGNETSNDGNSEKKNGTEIGSEDAGQNLDSSDEKNSTNGQAIDNNDTNETEKENLASGRLPQTGTVSIISGSIILIVMISVAIVFYVKNKGKN